MVGEMGADDTWVQAVGHKTLAAKLLGKRHGEEHVGSLGLTVCGPPVVRPAILLQLDSILGGAQKMTTHIEVIVTPANMTEAVAVATHVDNTRRFCREQLVHDKVGKEKVTKVISSKLALNLVRRQLVVGSHDAGIIHQDIDGGDVSP